MYGELQCWWGNWPLGTNLLSSLVAFLVGVPVALIFLSRLASRQAQTMARTVALKQVPAAVNLFTEALLRRFVAETPDAARSSLHALQTACKALRHAASQPNVHRVPPSSHLAAEVKAINRALEQTLDVEVRGSQQKQWFAELRAYWRQVEVVLGPYLYDSGLRPEQPVRIQEALTNLTAESPTPFMRMTAGSTAPDRLRARASAILTGAEALLYLLDQVDDLNALGSDQLERPHRGVERSDIRQSPEHPGALGEGGPAAFGRGGPRRWVMMGR
ncbi:hypothetical protein J7E91_16520 [Streptomyces sp. ISL-99]|uniref:hypothetical protein n=1 Tax=Streptomyces sp. ISL-99 TaxID=2819193 RepID=UPI001BE8114A|nr:hypothetical protein [Streptomyces sp. ISL-99]MBT2526986.1 hypothetical protein [Streptomyces sp. ISL-99]